MKNPFLRILSITAALALLFTNSVTAQTPTPGQITRDRPILSGDASLGEVRGLLARQGPVQVMVELTDQPTAVVFAGQSKLGLSSATQTAIGQLSVIKNAQKALETQMTAGQIGATVIFTAQRVYNGIAVQVDSKQLTQIAKLPGVKAIHSLTPKKLDNAYSVPFINAPQTWQLGQGALGDGIKVGVIDTGIDYLHTNFGGPGTGYNSNNTTILGDAPNYPGVKVAGGYDFAGDSYDAQGFYGSNIPTPDLDPMDCNGHGSHVAGTIAGYGVHSEGFTYPGPYVPGTPFTSLRIGPGVAPGAEIYGLRVFGCNGSTNLVTEALEWATDPNSDGDFSDHLDVVNMSLGSSFGSGEDPDAVASDNAVLAGVLVVASAGNSGDTYFVAGSPGNATRVLSVAASVDPGDVWDGFQVTAPGSIAGVYASSDSVAYNWPNSTDVTGDLVYPATNRGGCSPFPAGTFTGKVALLDWTHSSPGVNQCGSVTRTTNARLAGAKGVVLAYDLPRLDIAITGDAIIPSTITFLSTGNLLKQHLAAMETVTVTFSKNFIAAVPTTDLTQADTLASFSSRGPRRLDNFLKPDITAPGQSIFSTRALSGNLGESLNGTSMAAPHISGVMALLRQLHPTWSIEELKALAMNTASHDLFTGDSLTGDKYGPGRVGAGRVDAYSASQSEVVLYNADNPGAVSVSFGASQVSSAATATKTVTVSNKGGSEAVFNVSFEDRTTIAGVSFSLLDADNAPLTALTVPAHSTAQIKVMMAEDPSKMLHSRDITVAGFQSGFPRHWLSEASGLIILTPAFAPADLAANTLRLPVYAVPRPASAMQTNINQLILNGSSGTLNVPLQGTGLDTTSVANPAPVGEKSFVSAYQLTNVSPDGNFGTGNSSLEKALDAADLRYVGVISNRGEQSLGNSEMFFAVATQGAWSTPTQVEFDIIIDTNQDGTDDYVLFNTILSGPTDVFVTGLANLHATGTALEDYVNILPASFADSVLYNNNVMVLPVYLTDLGLTDASGPIKFRVETYSIDAGGVIDSTPVVSYDPIHPTIDTVAKTGYLTGIPFYEDQPGNTISVAFNKSHMVSNPMGILLLHHHNATNTVNVVTLLGLQSYLPKIMK